MRFSEKSWRFNSFSQRHIKIFILTFFIILFAYFFIPTIKADVISLNSGGNEEFVVTTNKYIEGFFFGVEEIVCVLDTCAGLGYNCGTWSDGCGGTLSCGTCASGYTCTSGTCAAEAPPGGGGGGGVITPIYNIVLSPTEFNINIKINTNVKRIITVTNLEDSTITVGVSRSNLTNMVLFGNTSLTIPAKQTVKLDVIFVASDKPGIYTGKIFIGRKTVLVTLNVKTEFLL